MTRGSSSLCLASNLACEFGTRVRTWSTNTDEYPVSRRYMRSCHVGDRRFRKSGGQSLPGCLQRSNIAIPRIMEKCIRPRDPHLTAHLTLFAAPKRAAGQLSCACSAGSAVGGANRCRCAAMSSAKDAAPGSRLLGGPMQMCCVERRPPSPEPMGSPRKRSPKKRVPVGMSQAMEPEPIGALAPTWSPETLGPCSPCHGCARARRLSQCGRRSLWVRRSPLVARNSPGVHAIAAARAVMRHIAVCSQRQEACAIGPAVGSPWRAEALHAKVGGRSSGGNANSGIAEAMRRDCPTAADVASPNMRRAMFLCDGPS